MNLEDITGQVVALSKQVGDFIRQERKKFNSDAIEYKGTNDLVSYVDKGAEEQIVTGLEKILPEAGFITEEKTKTNIGPRYTWIIDPLDGTTNFIHGLPVFSVSIALQEYDELVMGVVYEINQDECFYACKGTPAYLNGKEIKVSKAPKIADTLLATGFPYYDFEKQRAYIEMFAELMRGCHGIRRLGSAAVDLAYTACGRFDAYYEYNLNSYDMAAGIVIVRQAGGEVVNFSKGTDLFGTREVVATNGLITDELIALIQKYFPGGSSN